MEDKKTIKAGRLICVDKGEYSDYQVVGFFVALQDFDPMEKLAQYLDDFPGQKEGYSFREYEFLAKLLSEGLLLEIKYSTLYLGGYSNWDSVTLEQGVE